MFSFDFLNSFVFVGTTDEKNCKSGTFNNQTGQGFSAACVDCTPGYYCDAPALEEPAGPCLAGYITLYKLSTTRYTLNGAAKYVIQIRNFVPRWFFKS